MRPTSPPLKAKGDSSSAFSDSTHRSPPRAAAKPVTAGAGIAPEELVSNTSSPLAISPDDPASSEGSPIKVGSPSATDPISSPTFTAPESHRATREADSIIAFQAKIAAAELHQETLRNNYFKNEEAKLTQLLAGLKTKAAPVAVPTETPAQRTVRVEKEAKERRLAAHKARLSGLSEASEAEESSGAAASAALAPSISTLKAPRAAAISYEAMLKFVSDKKHPKAASESEAKELRKARLRDQLQREAAEAELPMPKEIQQQQARRLFADDISVVDKDNFKLKTVLITSDRKYWPISPLCALGLYAYPEGSSYPEPIKYQHIISELADINDENMGCLPLVLTKKMKDELDEIKLAMIEGDDFIVRRDPEFVKEFYDIIRKHWDENFKALLACSTKKPKQAQLYKAYADLQLTLETLEKAGTDYICLFRKLTTVANVEPAKEARRAHYIGLMKAPVVKPLTETATEAEAEAEESFRPSL